MNNFAIGQTSSVSNPTNVATTNKSQGTGFKEIFDRSIEAVSSSQAEAKNLSEGLLAGQHSNIHETMIAMEKSSISFKLLTKVQSKVIDAYKEVMRLQL